MSEFLLTLIMLGPEHICEKCGTDWEKRKFADPLCLDCESWFWEEFDEDPNPPVFPDDNDPED